MDFLLECVGFPPDHDLDALAGWVETRGESVPWHGREGLHLRYPLGGGLEIRLDRRGERDPLTLWPFYRARSRLRVAVQELRRLPDAPFGALIAGIANPPPGPKGPEDPLGEMGGDDYPLRAWVSDARRISRTLPSGHVLALSLAGFALDITYVGPNEGVRDRYILEEPCGAQLLPLEGSDAPEGCMELSLRIRKVRHLSNPLTGESVAALETDAPGRPLELFCSRWQLEGEGFGPPSPGERIEGAFLFTGRVAGGIPSPR